jgi:hypothetical protein
VVIGVDLAISKRKESADTVIFPFAVDEKGHRYPLLDHVRMGKLGSVETASAIMDLNKILKPAMILVENNSYQESLVEWLQHAGGPTLPVTGAHTGRNKMDETLGLPGFSAELERGLWRWYLGDDHHQDPAGRTQKILNQFREHPVGEKTDAVMALWIGSRFLHAPGVFPDVDIEDVEDFYGLGEIA